MTPAMKEMKAEQVDQSEWLSLFPVVPALAGHGITCWRAFIGILEPTLLHHHPWGQDSPRARESVFAENALRDPEPAMDFHVEIQSCLQETTASAPGTPQADRTGPALWSLGTEACMRGDSWVVAACHLQRKRARAAYPAGSSQSTASPCETIHLPLPAWKRKG